jgi:hypothetical protein
MMKKLILVASLCLFPLSVFADDSTPPDDSAQPECLPPPGGKCLTKEQLEEIKKGLQELDQIHKSAAILTTDDRITIIHDWDGRVYTNGGSANPIRFKLKIGDTVERDVAMVLQTQTYYRPKPPEPMFRLRIRAQAGLLVPQLAKTASGKDQRFWDAGVGWDFFQLLGVNAALYTGVNSCGGGFGYDLTRNFGVYVGYSIVYTGFTSSLLAGAYLSLN